VREGKGGVCLFHKQPPLLLSLLLGGGRETTWSCKWKQETYHAGFPVGIGRCRVGQTWKHLHLALEPLGDPSLKPAFVSEQPLEYDDNMQAAQRTALRSARRLRPHISQKQPRRFETQGAEPSSFKAEGGHANYPKNESFGVCRVPCTLPDRHPTVQFHLRWGVD